MKRTIIISTFVFVIAVLLLGYSLIDSSESTEIVSDNTETRTEADSQLTEDLGKGFVRDELNVYHFGEILDGVDPATFQFVGSDYFIDKDAVYNTMFEISEVSLADPDTFRVVEVSEDSYQEYYKDKDYVFNSEGRLVEGANPALFEAMDLGGYDYYYSDGDRIYYDGYQTIAGADPQTFVKFSDYYFKDKNHVYFGDERIVRIEGADPNTLEFVDYGYVKDKNRVYKYGRVTDEVIPDEPLPPPSNTVLPKPSVPVNDTEERLASLEISIDSLVSTEANDITQCRPIAFGSRACGGPETYLVYSVKGTDEDKLKELVAEFNDLSERLNEEMQLSSICVVELEPELVIADGQCQAAPEEVYGTLE